IRVAMSNRVALWLASALCCLPALASNPPAASEPIRVDVVEGLDEKWSWPLTIGQPTESFEAPAMGLVRLPTKYDRGGVEADRRGPIALHASTVIRPVSGPYRLILRSRHAARLVVDGKVVAETRPISRNSSGHEPVPPEYVPEDAAWHPLPPGGQERIVDQVGDGAEHRVELWAIVGGKGLRNETGELLVAIALPGEVPNLIGDEVPLTEPGWDAFFERESARLAALDTERRPSPGEEHQPAGRRRGVLPAALARHD